MYFYYVGIVLQEAEMKVSADLKMQEFMDQWDKVRKQTYYILAFSLNQVCHQEVPMTTHLFQEELSHHVEKLNEHKLEILKMIPHLLLNTFKIVFKNTPAVAPADPKDYEGYYKQLQFVITQ